MSGPFPLSDRCDRSDGHHPSHRVPDRKSLRTSSIEFRVLRLGLDDDLPGPTEEVEIVHIERSEINLQGLEQVTKWDLFRDALGAIDIGIKLRDVGAKDRGHADERSRQPFGGVLRLRAIGLGGDNLATLVERRGVGNRRELFGILLERAEADVPPVFDHQFEPARPADPTHRRRAEDRDHRVGNRLRQRHPELLGDLLAIKCPWRRSFEIRISTNLSDQRFGSIGRAIGPRRVPRASP